MRLTHTAIALASALAAAAVAPAAFAPAALAQTSSPGVSTPAATVNTIPQSSASQRPSAVQTNGAISRTAAAPVPGRNSFTAGEARRRITSAGFTNVAGLKKDAQGIWRGQAQKDGAAVNVSLDYQGNVTGQ